MNKEIARTATKPRILFVDDEPGIRLTLPLMLSAEGFEVTAAATVPEALELIVSKKFEVLIADLNIGQAGDGFTVVSAMRRTQPTAATFILTGYPDFQTALEAIRRQVDDYLIKPTDINQMVESIKAKLESPRHSRVVASKRVANLIGENKERIARSWLAEAKADKVLQRVALGDKERMDHIPSLLEGVIHALEPTRITNPHELAESAVKHGMQRKKDGYTVTMVVREAAIFHNVLTRVIQECLLEIELSSLIGDVMKIGETLNAMLEASLRAF